MTKFIIIFFFRKSINNERRLHYFMTCWCAVLFRSEARRSRTKSFCVEALRSAFRVIICPFGNVASSDSPLDCPISVRITTDAWPTLAERLKHRTYLLTVKRGRSVGQSKVLYSRQKRSRNRTQSYNRLCFKIDMVITRYCTYIVWRC